MTKVYMLTGSKGEYSDWSMWIAAVFRKKHDAERAAERMNKWTEERFGDEEWLDAHVGGGGILPEADQLVLRAYDPFLLTDRGSIDLHSYSYRPSYEVVESVLR